MSDYYKIQQSEIAVDKPLTVQLFDRLRKNALAIQEGSTGGDVAPKYLQASCDESTATSQSKDRLVGYRESARTSGASANVDTMSYKVPRTGIYGLHIFNSRSSGTINCLFKINGGTNTTIAAAAHWDLIPLIKGQSITLQTSSTGTQSTVTRMYLYTNNPMGDMQLMSGNRVLKQFLNSKDSFLNQSVVPRKDIY